MFRISKVSESLCLLANGRYAIKGYTRSFYKRQTSCLWPGCFLIFRQTPALNVFLKSYLRLPISKASQIGNFDARRRMLRFCEAFYGSSLILFFVRSKILKLPFQVII